MSHPVFDFDRGEDVGGCTRRVLDEVTITARVDETDTWIALPLRSVHVDSAGPSFEIGPYSVADADAIALFKALDRYGKLTGEFHHRPPGSL